MLHSNWGKGASLWHFFFQFKSPPSADDGLKAKNNNNKKKHSMRKSKEMKFKSRNTILNCNLLLAYFLLPFHLSLPIFENQPPATLLLPFYFRPNAIPKRIKRREKSQLNTNIKYSWIYSIILDSTKWTFKKAYFFPLRFFNTRRTRMHNKKKKKLRSIYFNSIEKQHGKGIETDTECKKNRMFRRARPSGKLLAKFSDRMNTKIFVCWNDGEM